MKAINLNFYMCRLIMVFVTVFCFCSCGETPAIEFIEDLQNTHPNNSSTEKVPYDTLIIAQWNIGHFSSGVYSSSTITGSNFEMRLEDFSKIISYTNSDIFCVNEYSEYFGIDKNGERQKTEELLFFTYPFSFIGHQSRYSCNAFFSSLPLISAQEQVFECNLTTVITHTSVFKATDCYYIESKIQYKGIDITLVTTHLAFDTNNPKVAINQIRELIERYRYDKHVIFCGDWNTDISTYDLFAEAGYQLGNHGRFGDIITREASKNYLDNIIAKGLEIVDFKVINSNLSDHKPVVAALVLPE